MKESQIGHKHHSSVCPYPINIHTFQSSLANIQVIGIKKKMFTVLNYIILNELCNINKT